jgi:hypothetical protein
MHEHNVYTPEAEDMKIIPLMNSLRKGTEIETGEAKEFNLFMPRILERISVLTRDLCRKGLITEVSGTPEKIPEFKDAWKNRHSYWGPKESKSSPKPKSFDIYDMESLLDRSPSFKTPTAKMFAKGQQPPPSAQV